jgi:hypothetical protein
MAYTEIHPIKATLKKALDYIMADSKTDGGRLLSAFGVTTETADLEMGFTLSQARRQGNNLAHHLIQSFAPGEATPEQAHEIGRQLADEVLQGKYEYVIATHTDTGHINNHIIFCAASFVDKKKYNSNKKSLNAIRRISDKLCRENDLSVILQGEKEEHGRIEYTDIDTGKRRTRPAQVRGKSRAEYRADISRSSYRGRLRATIDSAIKVSSDFDGVLTMLKAAGYEIKHGKYLSCRAPGQNRFIRVKSLGENYSEQRIKERITNKSKAMDIKDMKIENPNSVNLMVDIENSIKAQESKGYEIWAKRFNIKQKAATLNYLIKHGINTFDDLQEKYITCAETTEQAREALKEVEREMSTIAVLIKNVNIVEKTKDAYGAYKRLPEGNAKDKFRRAHDAEIILHEAASRALRAAGYTAPPDISLLENMSARLAKTKSVLYCEYIRQKNKLKKVEMIKCNVNSMLAPTYGRKIVPER